MSSLLQFKNQKHKIAIAESIYVLGGNSTTGGNSPTVTGDFVSTNQWLPRSTYSNLFNNVSFNSATDASTWTARTSGTSSNLLRVHFINNQYVYCGFSGAFATSTDSITWTTRNTGLTGILSEVTYGNGVYVIVAESPSGVASSTDAVTWTVRNGQTSTNLYSLAYGNGIFVYAGINGAFGTSTDGTTWSSVATGTTNNLGIIFENGIFARIRTGGATATFETSTDAITWTTRNTSIAGTLSGLGYGNGLWVYIGYSGLLATSADTGVTWTVRNTNTTAILRYIKYVNGIWILTGNGGTIRTSTDAITWSTVSAVNGFDTVGVTYSARDNLYLYAAYGGTVAYSESFSPTATNFYLRINPAQKATNLGNFDLSSFGKYYVKHANTVESDVPVGTVVQNIVSYKQPIVQLGKYVKAPGIYNQSDYPELYAQLGKIGATTFLTSASFGSAAFGLVYTNGIFVASAGSGIRTSIDGVTWTARTSNTASQIEELAYGNGLYVYSTNGGGIGTSTDAITWTARTSGTTLNLLTVAFANNLYVYGGNSNVSAWSTDAATWNRPGNQTGQAAFGITYANGIYVSVGPNGTILTSTDAITWTQRTSGTTAQLYRVVHNGSIFLTGGNSGVILRSSDAITWVASTTPNTANVYSVSWLNSQFVATCSSGKVWTSPDGITWTERATGLVYGYAITSIAKSPSLWLAGSEYGYYVTSTDLTTWSNVGTGPAYGTCWKVIWDGTRFIYTTNYFDYSSSYGGISWSTTGGSGTWTSLTLGGFYDVVYTGSQYVAVGVNGFIYTSTDGTAWVRRNISFSGRFGGIVHTGSQYIVTVYESNGRAYLKSTDGINWQSVGALGGSASSANFIRSANSIFFNFGNASSVTQKSTDGINWSFVTAPNIASMAEIVYANGIYVAVGNSGTIMTSTDSNTWTLRSSGITNNLTSIDFNSGLFVAVGAGGRVLTSTDGITWSIRLSPTTSDIYQIKYGNGIWCYTGAGGTVGISTAPEQANYSAYYNPATHFYVPAITSDNSTSNVFYVKAKP